MTETTRLSVPQQGRTIAGTLQPWNRTLTDAYTMLTKQLANAGRSRNLQHGLAKPNELSVKIGTEVPSPAYASATLLSAWLVARAHDLDCSSLLSAETWLYGNSDDLFTANLDPNAVETIVTMLQSLPRGQQLDELLPYLMEIFEGHGAASIRERNTTWEHKRKNGVFYTPSDIADFIVVEALSRFDSRELPTCLDPACGTGIFLRSALEVLNRKTNLSRSELCTSCLYGIDISPSAVQSTSFVLLSRCLLDGDIGKTPYHLLNLIQQNLACRDATTLSPNPISFLLDGIVSPCTLQDLFPKIDVGFSVIIGNPPYVELPSDGNHILRRTLFATALHDKGPAFPLFVEMMWKFANHAYSSAGMVVPLSIAYNSENAIKALRRQMQEIGADWRFHFFDRSPDSLFGDDVKTRCAIVFMSRGPEQRGRFVTSPLIRWSSSGRGNLFDDLPTAELREPSIVTFIPKLGSRLEEEAYYQLKGGRAIGEVWDRKSVLESEDSVTGSDIFYYSTAYNWLPIFRSIPGCSSPQGAGAVSNSLRLLRLPTPELALFTFGVLSSRLAYWLWRVSGDGFHLTRRFLEALPLHPTYFGTAAFTEICGVAEHLWWFMRQHPILATNKGITTQNFSPLGATEDLDQLDRILIEERCLATEMCPFLAAFVSKTTAAGRNTVVVEPTYEEMNSCL